MSNIAGDPEGIKLWNLMSQTEDPMEREYFERINRAATEYGSVWFTDVIAQRDTKKNQAFFFMNWSQDKNTWDISLFMVPEGAAKEIRSRDEDDVWEEIDPDLIVPLEV